MAENNRNLNIQYLADDANFRQKVVGVAKELAEKLNIEIEKGNDNTAFTIALILAALKDFMDIILTFLVIGLIPGVSFIIGLFLGSFLFFFILGKGWLLRWRVKALYWFLGIFIDGLPGFNTLPINTFYVFYAWRLVRNRSDAAKIKLGQLEYLSKEHIVELNNDISLLEDEYMAAKVSREIFPIKRYNDSDRVFSREKIRNIRRQERLRV